MEKYYRLFIGPLVPLHGPAQRGPLFIRVEPDNTSFTSRALTQQAKGLIHPTHWYEPIAENRAEPGSSFWVLLGSTTDTEAIHRTCISIRIGDLEKAHVIVFCEEVGLLQCLTSADPFPILRQKIDTRMGYYQKRYNVNSAPTHDEDGYVIWDSRPRKTWLITIPPIAKMSSN